MDWLPSYCETLRLDDGRSIILGQYAPIGILSTTPSYSPISFPFGYYTGKKIMKKVAIDLENEATYITKYNNSIELSQELYDRCKEQYPNIEAKPIVRCLWAAHWNIKRMLGSIVLGDTEDESVEPLNHLEYHAMRRKLQQAFIGAKIPHPIRDAIIWPGVCE